VLIRSGETSTACRSGERLSLAHRESARIERHDLVVEAREAPLVFADEPRVETAVPVARHRERQGAVI
jgi:hypothetical protein